LPAIRLPIEKPRSIRNEPHDLKPLLQGLTDPFLYNPRKVDADKVSHLDSYQILFSQTDSFQVKSLVVQNEVIEFVVTLQNPYIFDLELQELSLRLIS
jgi:trafficking protein particle complex subunit 9